MRVFQKMFSNPLKQKTCSLEEAIEKEAKDLYNSLEGLILSCFFMNIGSMPYLLHFHKYTGGTRL